MAHRNVSIASRTGACCTLALTLVLLACSESTRPPHPDQAASPTQNLHSKSQQTRETRGEESGAVQTVSPATLVLLKSARARFSELCRATKTLQARVQNFLRAPGKDSLHSAKETWKETHLGFARVALYQNIPLLSDSLYLSSQSPVDENEQVTHSIWIVLTAAPLTGGYLDRVQGHAYSGLIYSEIPITTQALLAEHQLTDPEYVTLGLHAMEFMLWGDASHSRRFKDYQVRQPQSTPEHDTEAQEGRRELEKRATKRRIAYLSKLAILTQKHSGRLCSAWKKGGYYEKKLNSLSAKKQNNAIWQMFLSFFATEILGKRVTQAPESGVFQYQKIARYSNNDHAHLAILIAMLSEISKAPEIQSLLSELDDHSDFRTSDLLAEWVNQARRLQQQLSSSEDESSVDPLLLARIEHLSHQFMQRLEQQLAR